MYKFANKWVKDSLMVWCLFSIAGMLMTYLNFFSSLDHAEKFKLYLFSQYPNKHFSLEKENDGYLSFLDINIFREKENLSLVFIGKTPSVVFILIYTASYKHSYPRDFIEKCIKNFLDRVLRPKTVVSILLKKDLMIQTRINLVMKCKLPYWNFCISFVTKINLINFFTFKDKIPVFLCSHIVYISKSGGSSASY